MKKITLLCIVLFSFVLVSNAQVRLLNVNEQENLVEIKNFGTEMVDISNYWFCALFNYSQLNTLTVDSGSLQLMPDATVVLSGFSLTDVASDLGLYATNTFGDASAMRDFTQWGAAGQGRESVAVTAGIWTAGDFLEVPGPFEYIGDGTQNGLDFWQNVLSIEDFSGLSTIVLYPNPSKGVINISNQSDFRIETIQIYNTLGALVYKANDSFGNSLDVSSLAAGQYIAEIQLSQGPKQIKKIIIQ